MKHSRFTLAKRLNLKYFEQASLSTINSWEFMMRFHGLYFNGLVLEIRSEASIVVERKAHKMFQKKDHLKHETGKAPFTRENLLKLSYISANYLRFHSEAFLVCFPRNVWANPTDGSLSANYFDGNLICAHFFCWLAQFEKLMNKLLLTSLSRIQLPGKTNGM